MLNQIIRNKTIQWLHSQDCAITELINYIKYGEEMAAKKRQSEKEFQDKINLYAENISLFPEEEFELFFQGRYLLDAVLSKRKLGSQEVIINGIHISKVVVPYKSNSGKSRDFSIKICWTGFDGKQVTLDVKESRYDLNRRNDSERNWGLGRG